MTVAEENPVDVQDAPAHAFGLPDRKSPATPPERPATGAVCPYLVASSGGWRSAAPHRDHRCGAVDPPATLSADKQRRLCVSVAHQSCPAFGAARSARAAALAPGVDPAVLAAVEAARRQVPRSAPIILEQPRLMSTRVGWPLDRNVSQAALVGLMVVAFTLVVIARLSAVDVGAAAASASPIATASPVASQIATASPIATANPTAAATPVGSVAGIVGTPAPTQTASPSPTVPPSPSIVPSAPPSPTPVPAFSTTYTVVSGDNLYVIASRFKTTVAAIKNLNGLTSNDLHVGQKLKIP